MIKKLIPAKIKQGLRVGLTTIKDLTRGTRFKFAKKSKKNITIGSTFQERITITQKINVSKWAENKKYNLNLAISKFQNLVIFPGEIFSFWHYLGNPNKRAGYKVGINIIKGKLDFDYGGGLCQLSGLLYHLALSAGIGIVERYPHSVDLYTEGTRYTPLGADATSAFGYKDLRLKNTLNSPLCFRIKVNENQLIGALCSNENLKEYELEFKIKKLDGKEEVETFRRSDTGDFELIAKQTYEIAEHGQTI